MKVDLFFSGCALGLMAGLLTVSILNWDMGPEFWPFVPAFVLVGTACVYASWGQR
jgi:hypothetical protein